MSTRPTHFSFPPKNLLHSLPALSSLSASLLGSLPLLLLLALSTGEMARPSNAEAAPPSPSPVSSGPAAAQPTAGSPPAPPPPPAANVTLDNQDPSVGSFGVVSLTGGSSRLVFFPDQDVFTPLLASVV